MDGQMDRSAKFNLVATFATPEQARAALQALERKGVEAADIELFGPGIESGKRPVTNDEQQAIDMESTATVAKRFTAVSAALAVVGAVIGGVLGAVVSDGYGGGILAGVLGGFIVGGLLGFLWGGYGSLPVNEQFADTFQSEGGETKVAVHADDEQVIDLAKETLRGSDARSLEVV
jgi:outer membrane lipoprotein SlyB